MSARFSPTANLLVSTVAGRRGGREKSETKWRAPRTRFAPPSSIVALSTAGFDHGKLVGASASSTLPAAKRAWRSARQSTSASAISPSTVVAERQVGLQQRGGTASCDSHAGSAKRRSPLAGARSERPAATRAELGAQAADPARRPARVPRQAGRHARGRERPHEARPLPDGGVREQHVERCRARTGHAVRVVSP